MKTYFVNFSLDREKKEKMVNGWGQLCKGGAYFKYLGERGAIIWGRQGMALIQGNTVGNVQTRTVNSSVTLTRLEIILSLEKAHR